MSYQVSHGADPEVLDDIAVALRRQGEAIDDAGGRGAAYLEKLRAVWDGPDFEAFAKRWRQAHRQVDDAAQEMRRYSKKLSTEAEDQRSSSSSTLSGFGDEPVRFAPPTLTARATGGSHGSGTGSAARGTGVGTWIPLDPGEPVTIEHVTDIDVHEVDLTGGVLTGVYEDADESMPWLMTDIATVDVLPYLPLQTGEVGTWIDAVSDAPVPQEWLDVTEE